MTMIDVRFQRRRWPCRVTLRLDENAKISTVKEL